MKDKKTTKSKMKETTNTTTNSTNNDIINEKFPPNIFPEGAPEDGEVNLNIVIPKIQKRIRSLEAEIGELKSLLAAKNNEQ